LLAIWSMPNRLTRLLAGAFSAGKAYFAGEFIRSFNIFAEIIHSAELFFATQVVVVIFVIPGLVHHP
jgi:hypothetical protein